jgi:hypothetical protein
LPEAGSHGQRISDRGLFSCAIPQWQSHIINLDGTRRHRCLVQSQIVVTRPPTEEPTVSAFLTVGFSPARYRSGNRTSSIWMGHAVTVALSKAKLL